MRHAPAEWTGQEGMHVRSVDSTGSPVDGVSAKRRLKAQVWRSRLPTCQERSSDSVAGVGRVRVTCVRQSALPGRVPGRGARPRQDSAGGKVPSVRWRELNAAAQRVSSRRRPRRGARPREV